MVRPNDLGNQSLSIPASFDDMVRYERIILNNLDIRNELNNALLALESIHVKHNKLNEEFNCAQETIRKLTDENTKLKQQLFEIKQKHGDKCLEAETANRKLNATKETIKNLSEILDGPKRAKQDQTYYSSPARNSFDSGNFSSFEQRIRRYSLRAHVSAPESLRTDVSPPGSLCTNVSPPESFRTNASPPESLCTNASPPESSSSLDSFNGSNDNPPPNRHERQNSSSTDIGNREEKDVFQTPMIDRTIGQRFAVSSPVGTVYATPIGDQDSRIQYSLDVDDRECAFCGRNIPDKCPYISCDDCEKYYHRFCIKIEPRRHHSEFNFNFKIGGGLSNSDLAYYFKQIEEQGIFLQDIYHESQKNMNHFTSKSFESSEIQPSTIYVKELANFIVKYFANLNEPLIPDSLYKNFTVLPRIKIQSKLALKIRLLPEQNQKILACLMIHLKKVLQQRANGLDAEKISSIFHHAIIRGPKSRQIVHHLLVLGSDDLWNRFIK